MGAWHSCHVSLLPATRYLVTGPSLAGCPSNAWSTTNITFVIDLSLCMCWQSTVVTNCLLMLASNLHLSIHFPFHDIPYNGSPSLILIEVSKRFFLSFEWVHGVSYLWFQKTRKCFSCPIWFISLISTGVSLKVAARR